MFGSGLDGKAGDGDRGYIGNNGSLMQDKKE